MARREYAFDFRCRVRQNSGSRDDPQSLLSVERLISWGFANEITFAHVIKVNDLEMGESLLNYSWVQRNHKDP